MQPFRLKNQQQVTISEATMDDAQAIINFYNRVGGESDYLSFGKNEFTSDVENYKSALEATRLEKNSIIYIATVNREIISIASIHSNQKTRSKHVGTLGIVVSQQFIGQGVGRKMMELLIDWAKTNEITRKITLVTREDNDTAIQLYEKLGFVKEGLSLKDNLVDDVYYNSLMMAMFV